MGFSLKKKTSPLKSAVAGISKSISLRPKIEKRAIDVNDLVPTPSTILNLRCSGRVEGAFLLGSINNIIGDSHSGKSILALGILAECVINPRFNDYELVYNDTENACAFDIEDLFGDKLAQRLILISTRFHENFTDDIIKRIDSGKKVIYITDSFDGMTTKAADKLYTENMKNREKGNKEDGSYGDGKAKLFSAFGSATTNRFKKSKSCLIVISQTRQTIGFKAMFTPRTRSGGDALKFYSSIELWLAAGKAVKEGLEVIATDVMVKISKNKVTGRKSVLEFPIVNDYGIDDIHSCITFLGVSKHWTGSPGAINTKGFWKPEVKKVVKSGEKVEKTIARSNLVKYIEANSLEEELKKECQIAYDNLMLSIKPNRKKRY